MSEDELDAAIMDGLRTVAAPYEGDVSALVDALNASGDPADGLLAERIVWVVGVWHRDGVTVQ